LRELQGRIVETEAIATSFIRSWATKALILQIKKTDRLHFG